MTVTVVRGSGAGTAVREDGVPRGAGIGELELESGFRLPDVRIAYETWGTLAPDASNAVLVEHALTGDTHVAAGRARPGAPEAERRAAESGGWWEGLIGPGAAIDTDRWFVVCTNIVGGCYGSTGPATPAPPSVDPEGRPWGSRFPLITVRDSVHAEAALADVLGIDAWRLVIGGSMGGARALEWAVTHPDRVRACAVVAACAQSSAEQLAWGQAQNLAIRQDPHFRGGDYYDGPPPVTGLGLARRIAHITYRSADELHHRFGRSPQAEEQVIDTHAGGRGRYQVESYLDHQAEKLVDRFDANSYVILTEALMSHDAGRARGSLAAALAAAPAQFFVAAVDSDRLYVPGQSRRLAAGLPGEVPVHTITSPVGHDAFLTEIHQLDAQLRTAFYAK